MSNLNFEPSVPPTGGIHRKKKSKQKTPNIAVIISVVFLILISVLIYCKISSNQTENKKEPSAISKLFQKEPDEFMKRKLIVASRNWKIPQDKIWDFYCAHDPEGYLIYVEKTRKSAGQDGMGAIIALQFHAKVQYIDAITGVALYEAYQKHPDSSDEFWSKLPGVYDYAFWADYGGYWNGASIFWTKE